MTQTLRAIIESEEAALRDQSIEILCAGRPLAWLREQAADLDAFRRTSTNLYHQVRALFFLHWLHRFVLPALPELPAGGTLPYEGYSHLLERRFDEAITAFQTQVRNEGMTAALSSALGEAYRAMGFQTLANQVRRSVRSVRGNQWMFRVGHPLDHPLRVRHELLQANDAGTRYPLLRERTPVRMDLTHSAWSDIFFLGMDYPEGAKVLNVSIDLGVRGRDAQPQPPIETTLRVIPEPVLRLTSVDLQCTADVRTLAEVFDFARDYMGLLKAALIASGLIPPGLEGAARPLEEVLGVLLGPGRGLELVSNVQGIPKGSRLAVSTNLLASLITLCMRATGQTRALVGGLEEPERRLVAARAILGEWLAGSGGGWQDSGGVWPGIKLIEGVVSQPGDLEYGSSRGCLLPRHTLLQDAVPPSAREALQASLILVHGGLAQNVGPILEMVTEKYLLRLGEEWQARQQALAFLARIRDHLAAGEIRQLAEATTANFTGPIQTIIPAASNAFTERLIAEMKAQFGDDSWGFLMMGGMSGGGMGFFVAPHRKAEAQAFLQETMDRLSQQMLQALPFAMRPVVYDFTINERGTWCTMQEADSALMTRAYYLFHVPRWLQTDPRTLAPELRDELQRFGAACRDQSELSGAVEGVLERLLPVAPTREQGNTSLAELLQTHGFDPEQHEQMRVALRQGRIGLAQNRLPATVSIEDVLPGEVADATRGRRAEWVARGEESLRRGEVAVVTLAAGAGSRWTHGAGTVKALNPFCRLAGQHRSFLEVAIAHTRQVARSLGIRLPHVIATGYLTHDPIARMLEREHLGDERVEVFLSPGKSVGLRVVPMVRDLQFAWEEMPEQMLDIQAQKIREQGRQALLGWAQQSGEGSDYTQNQPSQCIHPLGHWHEIPNLLRNGTLLALLQRWPNLRYLMVHNLDAVGTSLEPGLLGWHQETQHCLNFEVIARRIEDRGGGLARVDGRVRLVEGLALPRAEDETRLSYYNTLTNWIDVHQMLGVFGLSLADLADPVRVQEAVQRLAARMPTYITLKEVKRRWGNGQEDVFPLSQSEKLWGDMSALPEVSCGFIAVERLRGQQLKDPGQLDGWRKERGIEYTAERCVWQT